MQLNRARILLTGATGGLGEALASHLSAAGAALLLTGRNEDKLAAIPLVAGAECVLHYEKEMQLEEKKAKAETVKAELGGSVDDISNIEGILLLKQRDAEKKQKLLDAFDFRQQDKERTKQLVGEIDTRIAALNSQRYSLNQSKKKIAASLEEGIKSSSTPRKRSASSGKQGFCSPGRSRRTLSNCSPSTSLSLKSGAAISRRSAQRSKRNSRASAGS